MATENLTVQHARTQTASFDPKNRVLTCPIWEQMSGDLYDLLMGHEVGHAIDTPADGWHGAVHDRGKNYKGFLNVVEDARIEKRQKRRYPGLRRSFINGFDELMKRDFFGIKDQDINEMSFINRLNLFSKSSYTMDIQFTNEELVMIEKVKEWAIAIELERNFTKEEIIAMYLNTTEFSSNSYGIKVASETYFGKEPDSLGIMESAVLVGMLQNPSWYNPKNHPERAIKKRNEVLLKLYKSDFEINSREAFDSLSALPLGLNYKVQNQNQGQIGRAHV